MPAPIPLHPLLVDAVLTAVWRLGVRGEEGFCLAKLLQDIFPPADIIAFAQSR